MTVAVGTEIGIRRGDAPVGAEIVGVDLSKELDAPTFNRIRDAYYEHSVIVFRDRRLETGGTRLRCLDDQPGDRGTEQHDQHDAAQ